MKCHTLSDFYRIRPQAYLLPAVVVALLAIGMPSSHAQIDNESITIKTPQSSYGPGDTVNLTGSVIDGQPGQLVAIEVKDTKGTVLLTRVATADQNGNFVLQFKVPLNASPGNLNITASSDINGFVITQSKAVTTSVPEFPASGPVLAASIVSLLVLYAVVSRGGLVGQNRSA